MDKYQPLSEIAVVNNAGRAASAHAGSRFEDEITRLRIGILSTARQALLDDLVEVAAGHAATVKAKVDSRASILTTSLRTVASAPDLLRALFTAQEDYLVFSQRPGLIWDRQILQRVAREIAAVEELNLPWFCMCADGQDLDGKIYAAAFFNNEPTLVPDRGRKLIVQTAGTLYVVKTATMRALGTDAVVASDPVAFMNALIVVACGRGFASVFTSNLYPCLAEHRSLHYVELEQQLGNLDLSGLRAPEDVAYLIPSSVSNRALITTWIQSLASRMHARHSFSFVIRTLFLRNQMLRRCLISIEYLRISLDVPVEIVIATDADDAKISASINGLRENFPKLTFVVAKGDGENHYRYSRVRNLVAGLKATTGARVCIIDDDDYYAPQAVSSFAQACEFGADELVVFGAQIVYEKWMAASVKPHVTITGYGTRYDAKSWVNTLRGSNSLPLCSLIHPGWFVRQLAHEYAYDFDLSEDFAFHLRCFAHPKRPPIRVIDEVCAYQSHRANDDNVSNVADRAGWVADTGNGLFQLLVEDRFTFDVLFEMPVPIDVEAKGKIVALEAEIVRANRGRDAAVQGLAKLIQRSSQDHIISPRKSARQIAKRVLKRVLGKA